jgi:DNA-binding PadR family transcriptional regulator
MTALADGNLHVQTRKLADVDYLEISKSGSGRRSRTLFRVTDRGLYKLNKKLKQMQKILSQNETIQAQQDSSKRPEDAQFW